MSMIKPRFIETLERTNCPKFLRTTCYVTANDIVKLDSEFLNTDFDTRISLVWITSLQVVFREINAMSTSDKWKSEARPFLLGQMKEIEPTASDITIKCFRFVEE